MRRPKLLVTANPRQLEKAVEEIGSMVYPYDPQVSIKICENVPRFIVVTSASLRDFYRELSYAPPAYAKRIIPVICVAKHEDVVVCVKKLLEKTIFIHGQDSIKIYVSVDGRVSSQLHNSVKLLVSKFRCSGRCLRASLEILCCGDSLVVGFYPYGFDRVSWFRSGRADVKVMVEFLRSLGVN
ncbi:MAG TPA: hypothetical protein EYP08_01340 [Pyrodictiaceae archaeon]|nr:hypothetical protein [Pyrodictiaceae archaeon]HIQ11016.1 hypothetical protein [Pyrodictium sp.]HIQ55855.1 hypothetical protein [Pyrodictium sp.]